ncbi:MAG: MMPL family transporter [Vicinamibacteria bacterium]|nr:MMPL family transporter [Vicinamibacteria bacterium]
MKSLARDAAGSARVGERRRGWAGRLVAARGWLVPAALVGGLALWPVARRAESALEVAARLEGSESAAVDHLLASRFESPFARSALVVVRDVARPDTAAGREALVQLVRDLRAVPGVTRTYSHLDGGDALFLPTGGVPGTFVVVGLDATPADRLVPRLRAATGLAAERLRARHPQATLRVTGEPALNLDLRQASAESVAEGEARAVPLTLLLLLAGFGTVAAALLPLLSGGLAVTAALGLAVLVSARWPLAASLQSVVSMLGLGLGIDYALLTVSRFREAQAAGLDRVQAADQACRRGGATIAISGAAVAIGFVGLLLVPVAELRSLGVGGLLVVSVSVVVAVVVLPGVLAWVGPGIDAGRLRPAPWSRATGPGRGDERRDSLWHRYGRAVTRRPGWVLLAAGAPLLLLALQARRLEVELPRGDWLPARLESAAGIADLRALGRGAVVQEVRVVLELPEAVTALGAEGWAAAGRLERQFRAEPRVAAVRSLRAVAGPRGADSTYVSLLPGFVKQCFVASEGDAMLLGLVPREDASPGEVGRLVRELRRLDAARVTGVAGARLRVGGLAAFNADYEDALSGRLAMVVASVVLATLLALGLAFRSVLLPLKAVALNLLSVAAAVGALVIVFQDGTGAGLFGLAAGTGSVFPAVPVLVFAIVFGLSMDYEVFLVARVLEARRAGLGDEAAVVEGLAHTGGVITSAAAIMVAVFGAFAAGDLLLVQMLGFALAVAVALDATVIRLALGPALLVLAGRYNWWPGQADALDLVERRPTLADALTPAERRRLED